MSLSAIITPAILDKILGNLALLFLASAGGDLPTARHAASRLLACYDVETEAELRLAADIVSFGFHALDALGQSMAPDLPLKEILRLRGSAVSLNRQSHSSQRKLDQLRRLRLAPAPAEPEAAEQPPIDPAAGLIGLAHEATRAGTVREAAGTMRETVQAGGVRGGSRTPGLSDKQLAARRIAENLARNKAEHARREAMAIGCSAAAGAARAAG